MSEEIKRINEPEDIHIVIDDEPQVTIVRTGSNDNAVDEKGPGEKVTVINVRDHRRWPWIVAAVAGVLLAVVCSVVALRYWKQSNYVPPMSVTPQENIDKLKAKAHKVAPEVVMTSDSILGVPINIYELKGLKATIDTIEPRYNSSHAYFYVQAGELTAEGKPIGTTVLGDSLCAGDASDKRFGYFAAVEKQTVIGVSPDDDVAKFCQEKKGYFFRNYFLVSNSQLPPEFQLHGKDVRRALARMPENPNLFYIETTEPETMWDFADALRESGFIDAIYVQGRSNDAYYRTRNGQRYYLTNESIRQEIAKQSAPQQKAMWLVFKKQ
ncbi:MAG: hypothetical protein MJZ74_10185 [Muribaculaceae bacterium]|nr:hypothetical protein [Muribaculaceae bacterium]